MVGEPFQVDVEGPADIALLWILVAGAGAALLVHSAFGLPASTNLIRNWLISLCAQVSPQRCFAAEDCRWGEFQPVMRNSPESSQATNQ